MVANDATVQVSLSRYALSERSASVEIEPSTSISEPERLVAAESIHVLHETPADTKTLSTPLLLPSTSPRASRYTVPPPSGAHRRQSPRVRRVVGGRRRDTDQPLGGIVLARKDEMTTSVGKDTGKSSDATSSSNNNETGLEPSSGETAAVLAIPEYVEFGAAVVTTPAEVVVEPAAVTVSAEAEPAPHEYCYTTAPPARLPAAAEIMTVAEESPPLPPSSTSSSRRGPSRPSRERPVAEVPTETVARPRCLYCDEPFDLASNRRGACRDAPDRGADCVDRASCLCCARAVVYHCLEPADNVSPSADDRDPCACDGGLGGVRRCRRWTALSLLSVVVPCLCLYWPLAACHRCAVRVGCCGGRHSASSRVVIV